MSDLYQAVKGIAKRMCRFGMVLLAIHFVLMGIVTTTESSSQSATEDEIKAALMFKFPIYVRWSDETEKGRAKEFECCVLGDSHLSDLLMQFDGEKLVGKIVRMRRLSKIEELKDCHMLFISPSQKRDLTRIMKAIEGRRILTVGDMKGFARDGGIINFVRKRNSIHFEVNPKAAERAGLSISSKLLRTAEIVEDN